MVAVAQSRSPHWGKSKVFAISSLSGECRAGQDEIERLSHWFESLLSNPRAECVAIHQSLPSKANPRKRFAEFMIQLEGQRQINALISAKPNLLRDKNQARLMIEAKETFADYDLVELGAMPCSQTIGGSNGTTR